jgi:hypothetical protein
METPAALALPASRFVAVLQSSVRGMDQMLGYRGHDRFVVLYYEPRGEEVVWRDCASYGFATGAWSVFLDNLAPIAQLYGVNVGTMDSMASHVLLIDRVRKVAFFAAKAEAIQFLKDVAASRARGDGDGTDAPLATAGSKSCVQITHEAITRLAYQLWENSGRPQGQALTHWLEAESKLMNAFRN